MIAALYFISGVCMLALGVMRMTEKLPTQPTTPPTLHIVQQDIQDPSSKILSRTWQVIMPEEKGRFIEMVGVVNGKPGILGAWDTVRHEALFYKEHVDFYPKPK